MKKIIQFFNLKISHLIIILLIGFAGAGFFLFNYYYLGFNLWIVLWMAAMVMFGFCSIVCLTLGIIMQNQLVSRFGIILMLSSFLSISPLAVNIIRVKIAEEQMKYEARIVAAKIENHKVEYGNYPKKLSDMQKEISEIYEYSTDSNLENYEFRVHLRPYLMYSFNSKTGTWETINYE